ncbi:GSCFA domain-containing protein [Sinomicrobium soli]|uniref:GSCFA domain-containing protein n=1 Tax=Sinomicrobium sp. N-1-3-6 TaxID=2219864 RepID=UPI000DCDA3B1|nr:GSCFA domain-containing protein [Sinomicrobium sp. N-1-3-6]RAV30729.1 GSCFA domain-containing protein [Sinomicrobium sp. N-1-3-6]
MKLRTEIPAIPGDHSIDHHSKLLLLGSCFSEHMAGKLEYFQFRCLRNPFGILYHPAAIARFLEKVVSGDKYTREALFGHQGRWHCFDAHSSLSSTSREQALSNINTALEETATFLKTATHVLITLGTAWGYRLKETGEPVANCHKIPQKHFEKELASAESVTGNISGMISALRKINPEVQIIFTISPVRHLRDGFVENQRSKAHLVTAVHQVTDPLSCFYFPSYEIVMDELRDYRFYTDDMIHPSDTAIQYIWEKFSGAWISPAAHQDMKEVDAIRKGLSHKPFAPDSPEHRDFRCRLEDRIRRLRSEWPHMEF